MNLIVCFLVLLISIPPASSPATAGLCAAADAPAAGVCVVPAGPGGRGRRWHAALLRPAPPEPTHHHEVPSC